MGAILQSALKCYQEDRNLVFRLGELSLTAKKCYSLHEMLKPARAKQKIKQISNLMPEFFMRYNSNYDPCSDFDEANLICELEKMIKECEAIVNSSKKENKTSLNEPKKCYKKGKNKLKPTPLKSRVDQDVIYMKAQTLLHQTKDEIRECLRNSSKSRSRNSTSSPVIGGNLAVSQSNKIALAPHIDELNLIKLLISEYNSSSCTGLDSILECYLAHPRKSLKISLYTAILLSVVYTKHSKTVDLMNLGLLQKRINFSRVIPFPTTSGLKTLLSKYYRAKALDTLVKAEEVNYTPQSTYDKTCKEFSSEAHYANQNSSKLCLQFLWLYHSKAVSVSTDVSLKLELFLKQLGILNKISQLISPDTIDADKENVSPQTMRAKNQLKFEQIQALIEEAKQVPDMDKFTEYERLYEIYTQKIENQSSLEKCSISKEWVSPEFGLNFNSDEKGEDFCRKDLREIMKNIENFPEAKSAAFSAEKAKCDDFNHLYETDWLFDDVPRQSEENMDGFSLFSQSFSNKELTSMVSEEVSKENDDDEVQIIEIKTPQQAQRKEMKKCAENIQKKIQNSEKDDAYEISRGRATEIESWDDLYNKTVSPDMEDFLRDKAELFLDDSGLRDCIMNLRSNFQKLLDATTLSLPYPYADLKTKIISLQKHLGWIEWLLRAKECTDNLGLADNDRLTKLQKLAAEAPELEIPKCWRASSRVIELFTLADSALAEYKQKFQYSNSYEKWTKSPQKKELLQNLLTKNNKKPLFSEAKALKEIFISKLHFINCKEEIADLEAKVGSYIAWKGKMEQFAINERQRIVKSAMESFSGIKNIKSVELQLEQLHREYVCLCLRDEQDEKTLLGLASQLRAYTLGKSIGRSVTAEEWKSLLHYAENHPNEDITNNPKLIASLKSELDGLKEQHKIVKDLRDAAINGVKTDLTFEDLCSTLKSYEKRLLSVQDDEKFIKELVQKVERLIERKNYAAQKRKSRLLNSQKLSIK